MAAAAVYAAGIFNDLQQTGFNAPNSQSRFVDNIVTNDFGGNLNSLVVLFSSPKLKYTDPLYRRTVQSVVAKIARLKDVSGTSTFYSTGGRQFVSNNPHYTYALIGLRGNANQQASEVAAIRPMLKNDTLRITLGGTAAADSELTGYIQQDLATAAKISFPLTAILLVVIFGSLAAAALPLALGLYGIIGALFIARLVTIAMPVSVYVLDIVSLLGLGLGIDYSLFIVNRFREELKRQTGEEEALCRTMATAGKTVIFSGLTVMIAVAGLIIFPLDYLRSMGVGGAASVMIAVVGSLLFLPALLAVMGNNVNALKVSSLLPKKLRLQDESNPVWARIAAAVIRYPIITIIATLSVLLLAGTPILNAHYSISDYKVLPKSAPARIVAGTLTNQFKYGNQSPIDVLVPLSQIKRTSNIRAYVSRLVSLPDITGLESYSERNGFLLLRLLPDSGSSTVVNENTVRQIRKLTVDGIHGLVGGESADLVDFIDLITHYAIYAVIVVFVAMLVLFYLLLGSIVIPLKTIILTALSLSAAFGFLVWVFQEGHLDYLIGITPLNGLDASQLVIIFALGFGLSMDYAAFLFSRIKENFVEHADMSKAIIWGVQQTGRIITSAALLLIAVVSAFAVGRVVSMKEVAIGLIVAITIDVFIVRLLLVPASMKLLGKYNWWLPKPLKFFHERFSLKER